ncbi:MAG: trigger factor [Cyanobacteria bacterium QS_8_64_29]|nr:MAG: trigger factor [Cyanobacteria bacterium QS_8_64_29]
MRVTQEQLPGSQIGLEIEIPAERSQQAYDRVVKNLAQSADIPGFRKGKVPRQVLIQRLGPERIKAAALEDLLEQILDEVIEQEQIEAISKPQLRSSFEALTQNYQPGQTLTVSAAVDVSPEVKLDDADYQQLSVRAEQTPEDDEAIAEQVEQFLQQRRAEQATLVPVEDRPAQWGDTVVIDYQGRLAESEDEAPLEGAQDSDFQLDLEEGEFIEGIVSGIVGMQQGQTQAIEVTFEGDYPQENLAGRNVTFNVTLNEIKARELPELDDEFAQEVGEYESLSQMRESLASQFKEQAQQETQNSIRQALNDALLERVEIDLPESMIDREVQTMLTQTAMELSQYGIDVRQVFTDDTIPQMKERSRPEAIQRLKQSLVLIEVAKRQGLEPQQDEIDSKIESLKQELSDQDYDPERMQQMVTDDLRKEKALEWLEQNAAIELVPQGTLQSEESEQDEQEQQPESEAGETEQASEQTVDVSAQDPQA